MLRLKQWALPSLKQLPVQRADRNTSGKSHCVIDSSCRGLRTRIMRWVGEKLYCLCCASSVRRSEVNLATVTAQQPARRSDSRSGEPSATAPLDPNRNLKIKVASHTNPEASLKAFPSQRLRNLVPYSRGSGRNLLVQGCCKWARRSSAKGDHWCKHQLGKKLSHIPSQKGAKERLLDPVRACFEGAALGPSKGSGLQLSTRLFHSLGG